MTSLRADLVVLANHAADIAADAPTVSNAADLSEELQKINWQRLICFAIPIYNLIAPMSGLPPLPVPAFCTTPPPTIPDGA